MVMKTIWRMINAFIPESMLSGAWPVIRSLLSVCTDRKGLKCGDAGEGRGSGKAEFRALQAVLILAKSARTGQRAVLQVFLPCVF